MASVDIMISGEGTSFYQKMMVPIRILYILIHFHKYKFRGKLKSEGLFETNQMIKLSISIEVRQPKIKEKKKTEFSAIRNFTLGMEQIK